MQNEITQRKRLQRGSLGLNGVSLFLNNPAK